MEKFPGKKIIKLFNELAKIQKKAKKLGLFINDRDLLECPECGLKEDVSCGGMLFTKFERLSYKDTGLRFKEIRGRRNYFKCPNCENKIKAKMF